MRYIYYILKTIRDYKLDPDEALSLYTSNYPTSIIEAPTIDETIKLVIFISIQEAEIRGII